MWRNLADLLKVIPENKWKYFRKHRFKCRLVGEGKGLQEYIDTNGGRFRLGALYKHDWGPGHSINVVPIDFPNSWTTTDVNHIEVYIGPKAYIEKLAPIVLSQ